MNENSFRNRNYYRHVAYQRERFTNVSNETFIDHQRIYVDLIETRGTLRESKKEDRDERILERKYIYIYA